MTQLAYVPCRCGGPKCPAGAAGCSCEECAPGRGINYRARHALVRANQERETTERLERLARKDPKMLTAGERQYLQDMFSD